jgi:hypothetical protein
MRAVSVVPIEIELQFAAERRKTIGNENQPPRALVFDGPDTALDHRQASVLPQRPKAKLNPSTSTPAPKSFRDELLAVVRDEVVGSFPSPMEGILKESLD